jgi:hypothetical protein
MAARRVYPLVSTPWQQNIKMSVFKNRLLLNHASHYVSTMIRQTFRPQSPDSYVLKSWAKFETENFDGINLITGLYKKSVLRSIGSAEFRVFAESTDANWTEVLVTAVSGVATPDGRFKASVPESTFGSIFLDGEVTLRIEVDVLRQGKTFKDVFYINHVGIYGSFFILKKKVEFLDLTKLDE